MNGIIFLYIQPINVQKIKFLINPKIPSPLPPPVGNFIFDLKLEGAFFSRSFSTFSNLDDLFLLTSSDVCFCLKAYESFKIESIFMTFSSIDFATPTKSVCFPPLLLVPVVASLFLSLKEVPDESLFKVFTKDFFGLDIFFDGKDFCSTVYFP